MSREHTLNQPTLIVNIDNQKQSIQSLEQIASTVKQNMDEGGLLGEPPTVKKLEISPWVIGVGERNPTENTIVRGSHAVEKISDVEEQEKEH